jgi:hypothetical protein
MGEAKPICPVWSSVRARWEQIALGLRSVWFNERRFASIFDPALAD